MFIHDRVDLVFLLKSCVGLQVRTINEFGSIIFHGQTYPSKTNEMKEIGETNGN